tara:strand:+ start:160 stop:393 length:234 start_codon:yes stop_codon:yes gene_type:complete
MSNFDNLIKKTSKVEPDMELEFGFLTARFRKQDAKRFKRAAEDNGLTIQSGLVEAVNRLMLEWGAPPVVDHGSAGKK